MCFFCPIEPGGGVRFCTFSIIQSLISNDDGNMATRAFFVLAKLSNIKCQQNIRQCLVKGRQVFPPMLYQQCHLPYSIARLLQGGKEAQACTTDAVFLSLRKSPTEKEMKVNTRYDFSQPIPGHNCCKYVSNKARVNSYL